MTRSSTRRRCSSRTCPKRSRPTRTTCSARQDVQSLVDHLKTSHAALVAELLPDLVTLGVIQRVLQNLLREGVAILNLPLILEGIADFASLSKNPDDLSELVRRRLGLYFVPELESRPGVLRALTLDPRLEQFLGTKVHRSPTDVGLALDPATGRHLIDELNRRVAQLTSQGCARRARRLHRDAPAAQALPRALLPAPHGPRVPGAALRDRDRERRPRAGARASPPHRAGEGGRLSARIKN
ncbi:MAG: FHIPEP family type III secretion protein [Lacunisphaera sp.]